MAITFKNHPSPFPAYHLFTVHQDDEKKALEKLTKSTSKSISGIMREAIDLWSSKRRKLCMD